MCFAYPSEHQTITNRPIYGLTQIDDDDSRRIYVNLTGRTLAVFAEDMLDQSVEVKMKPGVMPDVIPVVLPNHCEPEFTLCGSGLTLVNAPGDDPLHETYGLPVIRDLDDQVKVFLVVDEPPIAAPKKKSGKKFRKQAELPSNYQVLKVGHPVARPEMPILRIGCLGLLPA